MELEERRVAASADTRSVRVFAVLVGAVALGAGTLVTLLGAERPDLGAVLLLAFVVLIAVNRAALFPNEHAATAEAAVLLAAVVAFRDQAAFLGPFAVALLVGPLDMLHWSQRSFLRMGYNAGNRGLSTLAAAGAFAALTRALDGAPPVLTAGVATVGAVAAFTAIDVGLSTTLLRLQGESFPAAIRDVLAIDVLAVPIAIVGSICGFLEPVVGWWAVALTLLPLVFIPELVLARRRWRVDVVRDVVIVIAVGATLVALAFVAPRPSLMVVGPLVALAWVAGSRFGTDRWRVPPTLALLVTAAAIVVDDRSAFLVATLTALTGTVAASRARGGPSPHPLVLLLALVGACGATAVSRVVPPALPGVALGALLTGAVFVAVTVMPGGSRRANAGLLWAGPVLAGAVAWALLWRSVGAWGAVAFAVGLAALVAGASWWGACPWRTPPALRRAGDRLAPRLFLLLLMTAFASLVLVTAAIACDDPGPRRALVWAGAALGEVGLAMVLAGVAQWRFAPRARATMLAGLLAVGAVLVVVVPSLVVAGHVTAVPLHLVCLAAIVFCGRTPAARTREVAEASARR